jgi:hypothetical protein
MLSVFASRETSRNSSCGRLSNSVAADYRLPWGPKGIGLVFGKFDGERHEEISFVSNGASNGFEFGARGGFGGDAREGATAGAIRALGRRLRQRDHE